MPRCAYLLILTADGTHCWHTLLAAHSKADAIAHTALPVGLHAMRLHIPGAHHGSAVRQQPGAAAHSLVATSARASEGWAALIANVAAL